jgi:hypothetical protein
MERALLSLGTPWLLGRNPSRKGGWRKAEVAGRINVRAGSLYT